jgi:mannose-6-phosphate isomerase
VYGDHTVLPQALPPNVLTHFYAGGARIAALRGLELDSDRMPEEWIGAVNPAFGHRERGLARLADGTLVRDAIAADPAAYLGPAPGSGLLVKLLDAGERLPVHFHPGRAFAREALGSPYGKTEAWLILDAEPGATVHVGWRRPVAPDELRGWIRDQDAAAMLAALHAAPVAPGDAIFVPAGTPHAIGAGILLLELQEPTDFSVLLEWDGFPLTEADAHLGLGWETALRALDRAPGEPGFVRHDGSLPAAADPFFRAERLAGAFDAGFSILVGLEGDGALATAGGELPFGRGSAVLLPHAAGAGELRGDAAGIRCRPGLSPAPAPPGS